MEYKNGFTYKEFMRRAKLFFVFSVILIYYVCGYINVNAKTNDTYTVEPIVENCEGLGSLDDVGEDTVSFFNLKPGSLEFEGSYREQLDDDSKVLYDNFYNWYKNGAEIDKKNAIEIAVDIPDATIEWVGSNTYSVSDDRVMIACKDLIVPAMLALIYDHPEISWIVNAKYTYSCSIITGSVHNGQETVDIVGFNLKIWFTENNVGTKAEMDSAITKAKKAIGKVSGEHDTLKGIHDYLAETIVYNSCAAGSGNTVNGKSRDTAYSATEKDAYQTAYSAFYECNNDDYYYQMGKNYTVCAGYARGFKVLCDAYGIPCIYVSGTGNGGGHAWNYVQLNENWYAVDCTWDDQESGLIYEYFLVGSDTFNLKHKESGKWIDSYTYTFFYPVLATEKYCEHKDDNEDCQCDNCDKIIEPGLSVSQASWVYGEKNIPEPVVTVANDSEAEDYSILYKKKTDADDDFIETVPVDAGEYIIKIVLPHRCTSTVDYPTTEATTEFKIEKATLDVTIPDDTMVMYRDGLKLSDILLRDGKWVWDEPDEEVGTLQVDSAGVTRQYDAHYTLPDEKNYNPVTAKLSVQYMPCTHVNTTAVIKSEASCTSKGLIEYVCDYCKMTADTKEQEILEHSYVWIVDQNASVEAEGSRHEECKNCHQKGKSETIPKLTGQNNPDKPADTNVTTAATTEVTTTEAAAGETKPVQTETQYIKSDKESAKVIIPDTVNVDGVSCKVTSIAPNTFKNDKKITSVTIGKNVTKIGANAFAGCKNLKTIIIKSTNLKSIDKNAFKNINKNAVIKVPKSKYKKYKKLFKSKVGFKKTMKIKK